MTTQVIFKIDKKLKQAAQKLARQQGIALSDFYQHATRSFVAGETTIGLVNKQVATDMNKALTTYIKEKKGGKLKLLRSLQDLR